MIMHLDNNTVEEGNIESRRLEVGFTRSSRSSRSPLHTLRYSTVRLIPG